MLKRIINLSFVLIIIVASLITKEPFASDEDFSSLTIWVNPEIETLLIDTQGNKTGFDPFTNTYVSQIPRSGRQVDEVPSIPPVRITGIVNPTAGTYVLKTIGTTQRTYGLVVLATDSSGTTYDLKFIGFTLEGLISSYAITYDPTPGITPKVERVVTVEDLKNDVNIAYNLNLITNGGIRQSLLSKLDVAEKAIQRGNKHTAENQLNAFINEVNAQKDKHIKENAVKILIEDAEYLINH